MACYRSGGCGPYEMLSCSECPASKGDYIIKQIRKHIEETWPDWKIEIANEYIESVHGQKLRLGMQNNPVRCDSCECWRWDKEYEYEYCLKDAERKRLPVYRPPWCPKIK